MYTQFPSFYVPTVADIDLTAQSTAVAVDANVLLNLHRYPASAAQDILKVMRAVGERLWLPYQAALEYQRNRLTVIADQKRKFADVRKVIEKAIFDMENGLNSLQLKKRHSVIDPAPFSQKLKDLTASFLQELEAQDRSHPSVTDSDAVRRSLDMLFANRVGSSPADQAWLDKVAEEGERRFQSRIPPGYMDSSKKGETFVDKGLVYRREFGDLILWKQIIQHCRDTKVKQFVYVTDDDKEDWWWIVEAAGAKRIGPRVELADELLLEGGVELFCMLSSERFVQGVSGKVNVTLEASTLQQVRDVKASLSSTETVICPKCSTEGQEVLGLTPGSSAIHFCKACGMRFHVHRAGDGSPFTREPGKPRAAYSSRTRVEAECPKCHDLVPVNFSNGEATTERYCMGCCSLLTVDISGAVTNVKASAPVKSSRTLDDGRFIHLGCPQCPTEPLVRSIWRDHSVVRAVCPSCHALLETAAGTELDEE